jgi:hypothetical protein
MAGFSLVETLIAMALGLGLTGTILQTLIWQSQAHSGVTRLLRERAWQQRTLSLIAADLSRTQRISATPQAERAGCELSGRLPVLHLVTAAGAITYTVGEAPSRIWRGRVLMRCGPAFDLEGKLSATAQPQNRVVLDGLASPADRWDGCRALLGSDGTDLADSSRQGFSACLDASGALLAVHLKQEFRSGTRLQQIETQRLLSPAP